MTIRKMLLQSAVPFALAFSVSVAGASEAKNWAFPDYDTVKDQTITGDDFTAELARKYQDMSIYEYQDMNDYFDAETYAERSLALQDGLVPAPFNPAEWGISDEEILKDMFNARAKLIKVLDEGAPMKAPKEAADAQAKYDCWVEQQEEGWQTKEIAACRSDFWGAMEALTKAMVADGTATLKMEEIAREVVYFDFDKAELTTDARAKVDALVAEVSPLKNYRIVVEGHADRSGPADYNQKLALERANTVRGELINQGLKVAEIQDLQTVSDGESDPAVMTADGVREPENRRVVIIVAGEAEKKISLKAASLKQ